MHTVSNLILAVHRRAGCCWLHQAPPGSDLFTCCSVHPLKNTTTTNNSNNNNSSELEGTRPLSCLQGKLYCEQPAAYCLLFLFRQIIHCWGQCVFFIYLHAQPWDATHTQTDKNVSVHCKEVCDMKCVAGYGINIRRRRKKYDDVCICIRICVYEYVCETVFWCSYVMK